MMQEQDTHLDSMAGTLTNLKEIAGTMNREIDDHVVYVYVYFRLLIDSKLLLKYFR